MGYMVCGLRFGGLGVTSGFKGFRGIYGVATTLSNYIVQGLGKQTKSTTHHAASLAKHHPRGFREACGLPCLVHKS